MRPRRKTPNSITRVLAEAQDRKSIIPLRELIEIERRIGVTFRDKILLQEAFIHRSYGNEIDLRGLSHNQRLEYLGDHVASFVIAEYLYREFRDQPEGVMTEYHSALARNTTFAAIIHSMDLEEFIRMSRGERLFFGKNKRTADKIRADLFEAIVGAIFIDRGVGTVEMFLNEFLLSHAVEIIAQGENDNAKSKLQELAQAGPKITPAYGVLDEHGSDHDKHFLVGVYLGEKLIGQGSGASKQEAEHEAARDGLKKEFGVELAS